MPRLFCSLPIALLLTLTLLPTAALTAPTSAASPVAAERNVGGLADAPLSVRSWDTDGLLGAEVRGLLDYPLPVVQERLTKPEAWCEFLPLVFNIKSCTHARTGDRQQLTVYVGRKFYETPDEAYQLEYDFRASQEDGRSQIHLFAPSGPHGTGDYRITVEARATADGRTELRMRSSFRPSLRSRLATQAYLSTSGRDKIGFSIRGHVNGAPVYIDGTGAIVERNAMRYYLALKAFFDTLQVTESGRFDARLRAWYAMTEKYPRQLFEMSKEEYLAGKRAERKEQLALQRSLVRQAG